MEKLFFLLLPPSLLGWARLQPWPCSYCWGKQKTTAMRPQTGLHHVYQVTESWAHLQKGWGSFDNLDSPSAFKAVLQGPRGLGSLLAVITSKWLVSSRGPQMGVNWTRPHRALRPCFGHTGVREGD